MSLEVIERAMSSLREAPGSGVPSPMQAQQEVPVAEEEQEEEIQQQQIYEFDPGEEVPFDPTKVSDIDIVASKIRTYNNKYPGNQFYVKLVHEKVQSLQFDDISEYRRVAKDIVHVLLDLRGGRFLKLKDGEMNHTTCTIMDRKSCVNKVAHALRTAKKRKNIEFPEATIDQLKTKENAGFAFTPGKKQQSSSAKKKKWLPPSCGPNTPTSSSKKQKKNNKSPETNVTITDPSENDQEGTHYFSQSSSAALGVTTSTPHSSESKKRNGVNVGRPPSSKKKKAKQRKSSLLLDEQLQKSKSRPRSSITYEAKSGSTTSIDKYMLQLITEVCNFTNMRCCGDENDYIDPIASAFMVLDNPLRDYTLENEPDKCRLMRLQIRHRFAAASAAGISPLDFSIKLLKLWGGKLVEIVQQKPQRPKAPKMKATTPKNANRHPQAATAKLEKMTTPQQQNPIIFEATGETAEGSPAFVVGPSASLHGPLLSGEKSFATTMSTERHDHGMSADPYMYLSRPSQQQREMVPDSRGEDQSDTFGGPVGVEDPNIDVQFEQPMSEISMSEKASSTYECDEPNDELRTTAFQLQRGKKVLRSKFSWRRDCPELEQFLKDNKDEYLIYSSMNYTREQRQYNIRLTEQILELALRNDYVFDPKDFAFKSVRDRIRCYYKSYVQTAKKRGITLPGTLGERTKKSTKRTKKG